MENIKSVRLALNLTQAELAERFGVSSTTLARWERGEVTPEAPGMLALALEALETRLLLDSDEFVSRKERIKLNTKKTLNDARKRVKHPQQVVNTSGYKI